MTHIVSLAVDTDSSGFEAVERHKHCLCGRVCPPTAPIGWRIDEACPECRLFHDARPRRHSQRLHVVEV